MAMALWVIAGMVVGALAQAQTALVRTVTLSAAGEAARVYVQRASLTHGSVLPGPVALPAQTPLGPALLYGAGPDAVAVFSSASPWREGDPMGLDEESFVSLFDAGPFRERADLDQEALPGWRHHGALLFPAPVDDHGILVTLATRLDDRRVWRGRLSAWNWPTNASESAKGKFSSWTLPGAPIAAAVLERLGRVAVLCRDPSGEGAMIHVRDVLNGQAFVNSAQVFTRQEDQEAVALAASTDLRRLYVLTSGYAVDRPSGAPASWIRTIDTVTGEASSDALQLPGIAAPGDKALFMSGNDTCWVSTHAPGTNFGYVTRVNLAENPPRIELKHAFAGAGHPPRWAASPGKGAIAVAGGRRLELWPGGQPGGAVVNFEGPVAAIEWNAQGLFLAEGNNLHQIDPNTGQALKTVDFQSGIVHDFLLLPEAIVAAPDPDGDGVRTLTEYDLGTDPNVPDTDGDGLHDGVDPDPLSPTLALHLPRNVTFSGEAVGNELRGVRVQGPPGAGARWRASYDRKASPWLQVSPRGGEAPDVFLVGINHAAYNNGDEILTGEVTVSLRAPKARVADGQTATMRVRVLPIRNQLQRILWIGNDLAHDDLLAMLSGAPYRFVNDINTAAPFDSLDHYAVAVVGTVDVASGTVARQALLDFVARGGALLFLGEHMGPDAPRTLAHWLAPVGITLDPSQALEGPFAPRLSEQLARHWGNFPLANACLVEAKAPARVIVPTRLPSAASAGAEAGAFAVANHGRGRIAVLASPALLQKPPIREEGLFLADVLTWLARARREVFDFDADGLPNRIEDEDNDGAIDAGETDPLNADTDGDGIPDGMEDVNSNGRVDDGETSPVNADSDGDGILDGADLDPLPSVFAPVIEKVEPSVAAAEGGLDIMITGRNFAQNAIVSIGDATSARAKSIGTERIVAHLPPHGNPAGATVDVSVTNPSVGMGGVLPRGFTYEPRSTVRFFLKPIEAATSIYRGAFSLRMAGGKDIGVGRIAMRVDVDRGGPVQWDTASPGALSIVTERNVIQGNSPEGGLWLNVSRGNRANSTGELAVVRWTRPNAQGNSDLPTFRIGWMRILAPNQYPLHADLSEAVLSPRDAP
jgi:hypothetical protein